MTRQYILCIVALVSLCGMGRGKAQNSSADFELIVSAPAGETTIECVRGCDLAWIERGNPVISEPTFSFGCSGATVMQVFIRARPRPHSTRLARLIQWIA